MQEYRVPIDIPNIAHLDLDYRPNPLNIPRDADFRKGALDFDSYSPKAFKNGVLKGNTNTNSVEKL